MYLKRILLLVSIMFIVNSLKAQQLEFMQPVGYQNPFLKSGQYITSLYYYSYESNYRYSNDTHHNGSKYINIAGFLGLTDFLTLSTKIAVYPNQKMQWDTGESTMKRETDFYINPEITLSYRPIKSLEIFGSYNYRQYTITQGPYSYLQDVPIGIDSTGTVIVEERRVYDSGMDPYDTSSYFFRFGLTYSGRLW
ncbi:MAG: hypothetical protein JW956_08985 [Calditrichaceae bacterium]|nr:hypothetical protein [Calditrichaceae bacterium]